MQLKGKVTKVGKYWAITCPALQADTQGTSRKDALAMMEDWVKSMLDDQDFDVKATFTGKDEFVLSVKDAKPIIAMIVARNRNSSGLSLAEISSKLGAKSRNAVHQYETGKHDPSISKLQELVDAMGYDVRIELVPHPKAKKKAS